MSDQLGATARDAWSEPCVGDIYERVNGSERVVVLAVRDEDHEKGLGKGYGPSMLAWPVDALDHYEGAPHPFDCTILCGGHDRHGPNVWRYVECQPEVAQAAIAANDARLRRLGEAG